MSFALDRLRSKDLFLYELLDCPGGFDSQVILRKYNEASKRSEILREIRRFHLGSGRGVGIAGPIKVLEDLACSGALADYPDVLMLSPEVDEPSRVEYFTHTATLLPLNGDRQAINWLICLAPYKTDYASVVIPEDIVACPSREGALADFKTRRINEISRSIEKVFRPGKTILFMGKTEYFQQMRISRVLRKRGFTTVFTALTSNISKGKEDSFDLVLDASGNYDVFFEVPNLFDFYVIHVQAWMNDHHIAAAAALLSTVPVVVQLNDLPMMLLESGDYDTIFGQGAYAREMQSLQRVLSNASGLLVNTEEKATRKAFAGLTSEIPPMIRFHCYPLEEFFAEECSYNPLSLVSTATVIPSSFPRMAFGDAYVLDMAKRYITPQGIEFHVYCNPINQSRESSQLWDHLVYDSIEPNFYLHDGLPPERLTAEIAAYGMGSMCYVFDESHVKSDHLSAIAPTKAFTYAEAGLPVLLSEQFEALCSWLGEYGACVCVTKSDLEDGLRRLLEKQDHQQLRQGMRRFREENSMERRIVGLLQLYELAVNRYQCV